MSDFKLLHLAYDVADYLYKPTEYASKFAADCKKGEEEGGRINEIPNLLAEILNLLTDERNTCSHSENESMLVDTMITAVSALYLYAQIVSLENATVLCIDVSNVIRDYANCVFAGDIDARKSAVKDLKESLDAAEFSLIRITRSNTHDGHKAFMHTVGMKCTLENVYKKLEAYIQDGLRHYSEVD